MNLLTTLTKGTGGKMEEIKINYLKLVRSKKKLTQQELADLSGVCRSYISRIEAGYKPRLEAVVKLATGLRISPNNLAKELGLAAPRRRSTGNEQKAA